MMFNCLKATKPLCRRQFTFYHPVSSTSWYSFNQPWMNERLSWPWSHPAILNYNFNKNIATIIPHPTEFNNITIIDHEWCLQYLLHFYSCEDKIKYQTFAQTFYSLPIKYKHKYLLLISNWQKWNIFCNIFTRFPQIIWSNQDAIENFKTPKNDILQQLSDYFNMYFSTVQFPTKNNLKLSIQIIGQYHFYLILKRSSKKSCR